MLIFVLFACPIASYIKFIWLFCWCILSFTAWFFLVSLTLRQDGDYYYFHQIANPFRCWIKLSMSCQRNTHYQRQSHCVKSLDILFLRWDWILCVAFLDVRLHLWPCELVKAIIDSQNNLSIGTDNVYNYISRYWMHLLAASQPVIIH